MDKLKIELFRYGTFVFGKVLYQDESLRDVMLQVSDMDTGFEIRSESGPELNRWSLYINGHLNSKDGNVFQCVFEGEEKAKEVCTTIERLVDKVNGNTPIPPNVIEQVL